MFMVCPEEFRLAKDRARFVCQTCGAVTAKWAGRCETCGEWNTMHRGSRPRPAAPVRRPRRRRGRRVAFVGLAGTAEPPPRSATGIAELDRVLGGGLVPASAVLVGGDPGIGKSTLLLQAAAAPRRAPAAASLYISGEESIEQVRLRARRLGVHRRAARARRRDQRCATSPPAWSRRSDAALVVIDIDPDHVARRDRQRARHRRPGARLAASS